MPNSGHINPADFWRNNMTKTHPIKRSRSTDKVTLRLFWRETIADKRLLALALLYPIGAICINTLVPLFVGKTLAILTTQADNPERYLPYFLVAAVVGVICNRIGFARMLTLQAKAMRSLQRRAFDALLSRSVSFHNDNVGGKLVSDALDFPSAYQTLLGSLMAVMFPFVMVLTAGAAIVFWESWQLGFLVLVMAVGLLGWGISDSNRRTPFRLVRLKASKEVTAHLADSIVNMQTVKTFAKEPAELDRHDTLGGKLLGMRLHDWQLAGRQGNNRIIALLAMQMIFVAVTIRLVQSNPSLLGIGIFAFSFVTLIGTRMFDADTMVRQVEEALLQAAPMTEILRQTPEILDKQDAPALKVTTGALALTDVHFRYQDSQSDKAVFSALNIQVKPGEKIGLVGPSGGGKSTLTRLLLRFEDIESGAITIDGQNVADVTQASLRRAIAYVPQEPLLFHRSVYDNIAYGHEKAAKPAIEKAARSAYASEFIDELPQAYDTIVGERGVKLSGGQRQRIAIARAILKDAPILVLDEATSALDSESEVMIQRALWKLMEGRTALVIAHRLSTIQKMDRIIVLENGAIAETGTHKQLLAKKGVYAKLWAHQSGGFLEE
jgi:ATP-binding cassette subfamily B protein